METWILIAFLMVGSLSTPAPRGLSVANAEFGTQEACQAALQTIKAADATGVNIIASGCHKSGFIHKDGVRMPKPKDNG